MVIVGVQHLGDELSVGVLAQSSVVVAQREAGHIKVRGLCLPQTCLLYTSRTIDLAEFYEQLQALEAAAAHNDEGVVRQLAAMIPTFTPTRENLKL